jgi:probable rRNA maturation factor
MPLFDLPPEHLPLESVLRRAVEFTLVHQGHSPDADLTVVLGDDNLLQELNRQFLGFDTPTDVLSFPSGEIDPETQAIYLGDILISYERALTQSQAGGHPVEEELQLLVVHGVLHLLGFDHGEPDEKAAMWAAQTDILLHLGVALTPP